MTEPLTQLEFVELLDDALGDAIELHRNWAEHGAVETLDDEACTTELHEVHTFEQQLGTGLESSTTELQGEILMTMKNGQRWRLRVEEIR